jgi:ABC-type dipeptide/oligopeptide/nickel transport system permease subunit
MPILYHPDHTPIRSVSGVELAQGVGVQEAKGFWFDVWTRVVRRPGAMFGLAWLAVVAFFAVFSPLLANGHPMVLWELGPGGEAISRSSPMLANLRPTDVLLPAGVIGGLFWIFAPALRAGPAAVVLAAGLAVSALSAILLAVAATVGWAIPGGPATIGAIAGVGWLILALASPRDERGVALFLVAVQCGVILLAAMLLQTHLAQPQRELSEWWFSVKQHPRVALIVPAVTALAGSAVFLLAPMLGHRLRQAAIFGAVGVMAACIVSATWVRPLQNFDYREREDRGQVRALHTLIPFSPIQGSTRWYVMPPGATIYEPAFRQLEDAFRRRAAGRPTAEVPTEAADLDQLASILTSQGVPPEASDAIMGAAREELAAGPVPAGRLLTRLRALPFQHFTLGTDPLGQDVLSQLLHACRLSISIGLVSTGIAVIIGVTMGALMGYFGGWIDLLLYRVVEIFMAIPVLFLLIVAAAVLPRDTYIMMAIIGCVTWTGAARFTRAEFLRLRNQDFVQSARAVGLPLRSILFKHMLPNGVTPVLVDSSFAIAAAILAEATLSYLGLGPDGQASWGKLLSSATGTTGTFVWWLAIFPGFAIFLTVLSYNLIGEALRDAIDPKLKKARV